MWFAPCDRRLRSPLRWLRRRKFLFQSLMLLQCQRCLILIQVMRKVLSRSQNAPGVLCLPSVRFGRDDVDGFVAVFVEFVQVALNSGLLTNGEIAGADSCCYAYALAVCWVDCCFGWIVARVDDIAPSRRCRFGCGWELFDMWHCVGECQSFMLLARVSLAANLRARLPRIPPPNFLRSSGAASPMTEVRI